MTNCTRSNESLSKQILQEHQCFDSNLFQELELPFIKMAATEVVSGVSGESEEKVRDVFDQAVVSFVQLSIVLSIRTNLNKLISDNTVSARTYCCLISTILF